MGICQYSNQLTPYLDGEASAAERAELNAHLLVCAACETELQQLRGLSRLFAADRGPYLPAAALRRLHGHVADLVEEQDQAERTEHRVLRITRILTGIAACLLLAGSLWLARSRQNGPAEPRGPIVEAPLLTALQPAPWDPPSAPTEATAPAPTDAATPADATADFMIGGLVASSPLPGSSTGSVGEDNE